MAENDILITFILDKSGSMGFLQQSTIDGVNAYLEEQVKEEGQTLVSLVLFDTGFHVRYVARDARELPPMSMLGENSYQPGGGTALYDAVGVGVQGSEEWLRNHRDFDGKKLVVIWTDGQENSSKQWRIAALNDLIYRKQNEGWIFTFMGSGGAAWTEAKSFTAIPQAHFTHVAYDNVSTSNTYTGLSSSTSTLRRAGKYIAPESTGGNK